jgi:hypothetical protein
MSWIKTVACALSVACSDRSAVSKDASPDAGGLPPGDLIWARGAGGPGYDQANEVAADDDGGAYVVGMFGGPAIFGRNETHETTLASVSSDRFVARFGPDGDLVWARRVTGPELDVNMNVATAAKGGALVIGELHSSAVLGEGESRETTLAEADDAHLFLAAYGADGDLRWAKLVGGTSTVGGLGSAVGALPDGGALVAGSFSTSARFGAGEPTETGLSSPDGVESEFLARFSADGSLRWARRVATSAGISKIAVDEQGGAVITGWFLATATFDPDGPAATSLEPKGGEDMFLAGFDADGGLRWTATAGGVFCSGWDVTVSDDGSVWVTGVFSAPATFGSGSDAAVLTADGAEDVFVARYHADGTLAWARRAGGGGSGGLETGTAVTAIEGGAVAVAGTFSQPPVTFESAGSTNVVLSSDGGADMFVARYEADGTVAWAKGAGGNWQLDMAYGIARATDGTLIVAGVFGNGVPSDGTPPQRTATFGPGEPGETTLVSSDTIGAGDVFVAKYAL